MEFSQTQLFLTPTAARTRYEVRGTSEKTAVHWGSMKLLINEIAFLALWWDPLKVAKPVVVYIGAAPGSHIDILAQMFPEFSFRCYDPRGFVVIPNVPGTLAYNPEKAEIRLYSGEAGWFSDTTAQQWAGRNDVFLICDIRSSGLESGGEKMAKAIEADMRAQERWYKIIKPVAAQLKFRLPYYEPGQERNFRYLGGLIMKGIWTLPNSTETRLIPSGDLEFDWDTEWYQDVMAYQNRVLRESTQFLNPFTGGLQQIDPPELLNDFDSVAYAWVLRGYLQTRRKVVTQTNVLDLSHWLVAELNGWTSIYTSFGELRRLPPGQRSTVIRQSLIREKGPRAVGARTQKRTKGLTNPALSAEQEAAQEEVAD